jgi:hypothetical protein
MATGSQPDTAALDERSIRKIASISLIGASIESYDFFIYGTAAALVFGDLFFPTLGGAGGTLAAFGTFAVPRASARRRRVGALRRQGRAEEGLPHADAHDGDRDGADRSAADLRGDRHRGADHPDRPAVRAGPDGRWAVGPSGPDGHRVRPEAQAPLLRQFRPDRVPVGVILGNVFFLLLAANVSPEFFAARGWRIPFLASIVLVGVAIYARYRLEDTPAFRKLQKVAAEEQNAPAPAASERSPVLQVLRDHGGRILLAAGAFAVVNATFYLFIATCERGCRAGNEPRAGRATRCGSPQPASIPSSRRPRRSAPVSAPSAPATPAGTTPRTSGPPRRSSHRSK